MDDLQAYPTLADYEQKVQESSSCPVHKAGGLIWFSVCWNPEEVDCKASKGVDLLARRGKQAKSKRFLLPCPHQLPAEGVVQIRSGLKVSSQLKI